MCVLFDTGASRSFIAKNTVHKLQLKQRKLKELVEVHTPIGGPITLGLYCRVPISYSFYKFPFDLIVMDFPEFDIILGLDWLTKYEAEVNCGKESLKFERSLDILRFPVRARIRIEKNFGQH